MVYANGVTGSSNTKRALGCRGGCPIGSFGSELAETAMLDLIRALGDASQR
jgi:hypothetical protein